MRTFIALEPSIDFQESLSKNLLSLKERYPHFRWMPKENLHITLVFLGEIDEKNLPAVFEAVEKACGLKEIHAVSGEIFTLPKGRPPNVMALGFSKGGEEISLLAEKIEKNLESCGVLTGKRKSFLPHITLARKKTEMRLKEAHSIIVKGVFGKVNVYESTLYSQGARYTVLKSFQLETAT